MMKIKLAVLFLVLLLPSWAFSTIRYVDNGTKESSATWSGSNGATYTDSGGEFPGSGLGYSTFQAAVSAMNTGDTIYLRVGTYAEDWGDSSDPQAAMQLPVAENGTAWTAGNFNTIASYPGEWAILDGDGDRFGVGYGTLSTPNESFHLKYWRFERLEFTDGGSGGLAIMGGPVQVYYCYFHDNGNNPQDDNAAGLFTRILHDSTIKYNYFVDNSGTSSNNKSHMIIYADYPSPTGIDTARNEIAYNLFETGGGGTRIGIKYKSDTEFSGDPYDASPSASDISNYGDYGDKIHHNFFDTSNEAIMFRQEFGQFYNNILDNCKLQTEACSTDCAPIYNLSWYNNTLVGDNGVIANDLSYGNGYMNYPLQLQFFAVNNILTGASSANEWAQFGIAVRWESASGYYCNEAGNHNWTDTVVDNNLIHNPDDSYHFGNESSYPESICSDWVTTSTFNSQRSATNYTNSTSGLFTSGYLTDPDFVVTGSTTIADGGIGGNHPYLSGVTIPSYIGAVNPDDQSWVAGVEGLTVSYLTSQDGDEDPTWIEGSGSTEDPPQMQGIFGNFSIQ